MSRGPRHPSTAHDLARAAQDAHEELELLQSLRALGAGDGRSLRFSAKHAEKRARRALAALERAGGAA